MMQVIKYQSITQKVIDSRNFLCQNTLKFIGELSMNKELSELKVGDSIYFIIDCNGKLKLCMEYDKLFFSRKRRF